MSNELAATAAPAMDGRRHDLDALRAFAMLLGIGLHASLSFFAAPWPVQDRYQSSPLGLLFLLIHGFRMPLFFILSGYFTMMLFRKRGLSALLKQRFARIVLPLGLSMLTILPLTAWVAQRALVSQSALSPAAPTSLVQAIRSDDGAAIESFLDDREQLDRLDDQFGVSPLSWAVLKRDLSLVERLLDHGADVNVANRDGNRPLHAAAFLGGDEIAAKLVERGADPQARSQAGDTPLQATGVPWNATQYLATLLGLPQPDRAALEEERAKVRRRLAVLTGQSEASLATPALANAAGTDDLGAYRAAYQGWLRSDRWRISLGNFSWHLFESDTFAHLWFLWFLCWMVAGFAMVTPLLEAVIAKTSAKWCARLLILVVLLPQAVMGAGPMSFGPDTSSGLLPQPHLLVYYGAFFFFGVFQFAAESQSPPGRRWAWTPLLVALLVAFPLWLASMGNLWVATSAQFLYVWAMSLGLIGLFSRYLPSQSRWIRYLSDSSYWLYLAHLPLVMYLQTVVRVWPADAWLKFLGVNVVSLGILLVSYHALVRRTWLGRLLNGHKAPVIHRTAVKASEAT